VFSKLMVVLIMMNVSSNHHIRLIINSEGPCDTDDWNNDAENSDITGIITF